MKLFKDLPSDPHFHRVGTSAGGHTIEVTRMGEGPIHILIIGGVHGDEIEGIEFATSLTKPLRECYQDDNKISIFLIPCMNPDGAAVNHRHNGNGVDLNRNMPTKDWDPVPHNSRYIPGPSAGSEPESKLLVKCIKELNLRFILSIHSFKEPMINTNGDCDLVANPLHQKMDLPIKPHIGYPTPGALGTYAGFERDIMTITLELKRGEPLADRLEAYQEGVIYSIYTLKERLKKA